MTGAEDFADRLHQAVTQAKAARKKLDKIMMHEICDARADVPLIELRLALTDLEKIAKQLP
jgi:hypothetical protein